LTFPPIPLSMNRKYDQLAFAQQDMKKLISQ
jgi:hypothetical protein